MVHLSGRKILVPLNAGSEYLHNYESLVYTYNFYYGTAHLQQRRGQEYVNVYIHSPIRLHEVVLN
jgi:hypothetical protein